MPIALALLGVGQINAFEDQRQRRHADLKACGFGGIADPLEGALFEPFVPDAETRPVPEEYFALVAALVEVYEQMTAEWSWPIMLFANIESLLNPQRISAG